MREGEMNPTEARAKIRDNPKGYKAAVMVGPTAPLIENDSTEVHLFALVGTAADFFKKQRRHYERRGYVKVFGSGKLGILHFQKPGKPDVIVSLSKRVK